MNVTKEDNIGDNQNVHVNEDDHKREEARGTQRHVMSLHQNYLDKSEQLQIDELIK